MKTLTQLPNIVQCKDCKYLARVGADDVIIYYCSRLKGINEVTLDDFCSRGELKINT